MHVNKIEVYLSSDKCCICAFSCVNDKVSINSYEYELNTSIYHFQRIGNLTKYPNQPFVERIKKIQEMECIYLLDLNVTDFNTLTSALSSSSERSNRQKIINAFSSINQPLELPEEEYEAYSSCSIS